MKKLTWTWKKILVLICGALGIGMLVSCYGVPNPGDDIYSYSDIVDDEDEEEDIDDEENDSSKDNMLQLTKNEDTEDTSE